MGYLTRVDGEITITPPLTWDEFKDSPFTHKWERDLLLRVEETEVETSEGTLTRRTAVAVEPASDDSYRSYGIVEHLQELVDAYGSTHTFTGMLTGEGEDVADLWRLKVVDGKAVKVKPTITWPED